MALVSIREVQNWGVTYFDLEPSYDKFECASSILTIPRSGPRSTAGSVVRR
jgi:hypothetical protein